VNSLAWLLWHLARAEDAVVNVVVGAREQVLSAGDWPRRLGVARLDLAAARAYRDAVGRRTQEVVASLRPERWDEILSVVDTDRAVAAGAFGPGAEWVPKRPIRDGAAAACSAPTRLPTTRCIWAKRSR